MNKLLGLAAISLTLVFTVPAELIEVTIEGTFNATVQAAGMDLSGYLNTEDPIQYIFRYDTDPGHHGTFVLPDGTIYDWAEKRPDMHTFYTELVSSPIISGYTPNPALGTENHYGYYIGSTTKFYMGDYSSNHVEITDQTDYRSWEIGDDIWEVKEWINGNYIYTTLGHNDRFKITNITTVQPETASVPEPSSIVLLLSGLSLSGVRALRKRKS